MCARRFLMLILILTLIVVGGAFAIFQFGGNVLLKSATPKGHFEPAEAGAGADYALDSSWISRPGLADDPSDWRPAGERGPPAARPANLFYIHPTTYLERDRWNAPLHVSGQSEFRKRLFVQSQASAFNRVSDIWAPRYRQAAFGAFLLKSDDARRALELAYRDVSAAFDHFLAEVPNGPIILAGHSQGALHLMRLLQDRKGQLDDRLVAAYVVGWPVDTRSDLPALGLPACRSAEQAGCILTWLSFRDPANPDLLVDQWRETKGLTGLDRKRDQLLCVNPLTGTIDGAAPSQANPGTLIPTANLLSATLQPARVGARCDKGILMIDGDIPNLGPYVLPGNNYHVYDYVLFWGSIRADAERRLRAWSR